MKHLEDRADHTSLANPHGFTKNRLPNQADFTHDVKTTRTKGKNISRNLILTSAGLLVLSYTAFSLASLDETSLQLVKLFLKPYLELSMDSCQNTMSEKDASRIQQRACPESNIIQQFH